MLQVSAPSAIAIASPTRAFALAVSTPSAGGALLTDETGAAFLLTDDATWPVPVPTTVPLFGAVMGPGGRWWMVGAHGTVLRSR